MGPAGGIRAQYDLRKILLYSKPHVLGAELSVGIAHTKFDKSGLLTDEQTKASVQKQVEAFADWIDFVKRANK